MKKSCSNIVSLPEEIIHKILIPVSNRNFDWHKNVRAVCRSWRKITKEDLYLREVDLFEMQCVKRDYSGFSDFKNLCLQHGNLSALYVLGIGELFRKGKKEEGLRLISEAADGGYDLAIYAIACLKRMMTQSEQYEGEIGEISRDFVLACRRKIHWDTTRWQRYLLPQWFEELKKRIDIYSCCDCKCAPYIWGSGRKDTRGSCDRCFWKEEMWYFATKVSSQVVEWPY